VDDDFVCANCGGDIWGPITRSVDPRFPLGLCKGCRKVPLPPGKDATPEQRQAYANAAAARPARQALSPLIRRAAYAKRVRTKPAPPADLWDGFDRGQFAVRER
jgi:hypothetical protein